MRTGIEAACALMDDYGVAIVTPTVDTSQPGGRQGLYFALLMAEQESENIRRRVKDTFPHRCGGTEGTPAASAGTAGRRRAT
jgi:hypothetical protein